MCIGAADTNPLCDGCYDKEQEWQEKNNTAEGMPEEMLCESCKELLKRHCWNCDKTYATKEEADIVDGVCKECRKDFGTE